MSADNGGPAFPQINHWDNERMRMGVSGMTMRDYFAAKAMQSIAACEDTDFDTYDLRAEFAYRQADAMLKERDK